MINDAQSLSRGIEQLSLSFDHRLLCVCDFLLVEFSLDDRKTSERTSSTSSPSVKKNKISSSSQFLVVIFFPSLVNFAIDHISIDCRKDVGGDHGDSLLSVMISLLRMHCFPSSILLLVCICRQACSGKVMYFTAMTAVSCLDERVELRSPHFLCLPHVLIHKVS